MPRVPEQPTHEQQEESIRSAQSEGSIEFSPSIRFGVNFLPHRGHSRLVLRHVRKLTASAVTANSPAKDCKHGFFHRINHSVVGTKPPVILPVRRGKEKCYDAASPECYTWYWPVATCAAE